MFEVLWLCFSWLPTPLNILAFGLFCLLILFVVIKLVGLILDVIPFL